MTIKKQSFARNSIVIVALSFIIIGIMRGENSEVLQKAVRVCLQCIGIG